MSQKTKEELEKLLIYGIVEYAGKTLLVKYFNYINKILDEYNLELSENFSKIVLSMQISANIAKTLCKDIHISEKKLFREIANLFNIINIED